MVGGISLVLCCHNSAQRLPQTLAHLSSQQMIDHVPWEVIVVDNASTDGTTQAALRCWPSNSPFAVRIVQEPRLGLSYARYRGFREAQYAIVSFVDDDNWISGDWVQVTVEVMSRHPEVGACGGASEAVYESDPPWWFEQYKDCYAVGPQANEEGDITMTRGFLWGAGLSVRKVAWQRLVNNGFRSLLVGRQGSSPSSGEDSELCYALRLAGWRLWYDPRLRLRHFVSAPRLEWNYLRRLYRGFGAASVGLEPYEFAMRQTPNTFRAHVKITWQFQVYVTLRGLLQRRRKSLLSLRQLLEGDVEVLVTESGIGRLFELLRRRKAYDRSIREVREAAWRRVS